MSALFGFLTPSPTAMIVLLILAVLLYGKNLPDAARTFGKKFYEFRRNIKGIEDEIRSITSNITSSSPSRQVVEEHFEAASQTESTNREEPTAPKFEPPPS